MMIYKNMRFSLIYLNNANLKIQIINSLMQASYTIDLSKNIVHGNNFKTTLIYPSKKELDVLPLNWQVEEIEIIDGRFNILRSLVIDIE
jgi:hypothetical protein